MDAEQFGVQHSRAPEACGKQKFLHSAEMAQGFMHKTFEGTCPDIRVCLGGLASAYEVRERSTRPCVSNLFH